MRRFGAQRHWRGTSAIVAVAALLASPGLANAQSAAVVSVTTDGDNITNSGTITATDPGSVALWAEALAGSACGTNTVNVTGNVTANLWAIFARGCGASTVNVQAGQSVTSVAPGSVTLWNIAATDATINIDGTVAAPSDGEIALVLFGTSSVTTLNGSAVLRGRFIGGDGTDELTINSGATWYTAGESDFWTGTDVLRNAGTIDITGDATFLNLEEFTNSGTLILGTSSLSIPELTSFTNSGTLVLGTGTLDLPALTSFTNEGTLSFGAEASTLQVAAAKGAAVYPRDFAIPMLFNNGAVDLTNGTAGDKLGIANDYHGAGSAMLLIDAGGGASDRLVVGRAVTGTTQLFVNSVGPINSSRILVVEAGSAERGSFQIANPAVTQLIDLRLEQSGGKIFIFAAPNATAFQPLAIGNLAKDMWYQSADTYSAYGMLRRSGRDARRKSGLGFWAEAFASRGRYGKRDSVTIFGTETEIDNRVEADRYGVQAGIDFLPAGGAFVAGLTGGYQRADADLRSTPGKADADGYNLGAYAQYGRAAGFHGGALIKVDRNEANLSDGAFDLAEGEPDFTTIGLEGEAGFRWTRGATKVDLAGGLAYVRTKIDSFSAEGIDYDFERGTSLRGRIGARASFRGTLAPFIDARLFHEFNGDTKLNLQTSNERNSIEAGGLGTWARLEAGLGAEEGKGVMLSGWAELGNVKGAGIRAGFHF